MQLAWHFLASGPDGQPVLRDGRPLVVGQWYEHDGPLVMCESGYHASVLALDALGYAPGAFVSLCEVDGTIEYGTDKLVATRRRALWCYDATEVLRLFARQCALDVADLWEMPDIVRQYLETGDESIRAAAWDAAWDAARDANYAARDTARDTAGYAAWGAAWAATNYADASVAASAAARDAARSAANAVARYAAWGTPNYAAASAAASTAARNTQNATLESMLLTDAPSGVYKEN